MSKVIIYDEECYPNFFLVGGRLFKTNEYVIFEISSRKNDYHKIKEYFLRGDIEFMVGFNNLGYDYPLLHRLLSYNYSGYNGLAIAKDLKRLSDLIINSHRQNDRTVNYSIPHWKHLIPQVDLKSIWHFDNKAKMVSLKWIQFMIDWYNLQDLPFDPNIALSDEQMDKVIEYWYNDIDSTHEFTLITKGETDLPDYKGKDKFQLRKNIKDEFNLNCLNFNDVKIGESLLKKDYCIAEEIDSRLLRPLNFENTYFNFGDCIPEYVKFKSDHFNKFYNQVKNVKLKFEDSIEFLFSCNGTEYTIAKGGIHSNDPARILIPNDNQLLKDCDVGSQYPNSIRKRKLFPRHLKETWLINYNNYIEKRLFSKLKFKETKEGKYKAFDEAFKLALNGGSFGKLGESTNWQYDPFIQMCVTIGNQFEILMLIEMFELEGIHVVSANTDGVVCLFDKDKENTYYSVCKEWETIVGNTDLGQLEYADYTLLAQTSVNDYLAITTDGKVKKKGDFLTDFEIHKNKSRKIVGIALENYFVSGIKPEETIKNHKNIFDFCLSVKGTGDASFYSINLKTDEKIKLQKINRFFISNSDEILIKEMKPLENKKPSYQIDIFGEVDNGERISRIEVGYNVTIFNKYVEKDDYNINYNYYISKCYEIINQIKNE